jgi:cytochrome c biogenesis protein CcdA
MRMIRRLLILVVLVSLLSIPVLAESCVLFFTGRGCSGCDDAANVVKRLSPGNNFETKEVYYDRDNYKLLQEYYDAYNVAEESQGLPAVFTTSSYFIGKGPISELLEQHLTDNQDPGCPTLLPHAAVGVVGKFSPENVLDTLTFMNITGSALASSFFSASLLIIFLFLILGMRDEEEMLKRGFLFIVGIFIAYFLFAMGWFSALGLKAGLGYFFHKIVGLSGVLVGLVIIKGFFGSWKYVTKHFSEKLKHTLKETAKLFTSRVGVFVIGFLASLFTFSGAGNTLLSMRVLLGDSSTRWIVWPLSLYYLLVFVLFFIVILLLIYFVRKSLDANAQARKEKTDSWKKHNYRLLRLLIGIVLVVVGLLVLF